MRGRPGEGWAVPLNKKKSHGGKFRLVCWQTLAHDAHTEKRKAIPVWRNVAENSILLKTLFRLQNGLWWWTPNPPRSRGRGGLEERGRTLCGERQLVFYG